VEELQAEESSAAQKSLPPVPTKTTDAAKASEKA